MKMKPNPIWLNPTHGGRGPDPKTGTIEVAGPDVDALLADGWTLADEASVAAHAAWKKERASLDEEAARAAAELAAKAAARAPHEGSDR